MKIGAFASFQTPKATADVILKIGQRAEEIGMDSLWMGEHVALFDKMEFPYPGSADGKLPVPDGGGIPDTVVTMGFLASVTKNIRLGTGVTLIPQRNPIYTANEFATLDWLTGGRIDLGIGVGWCKEEVETCGYSFEDRGDRCDEALELMKMLWTEPVTNFNGKHFQVKDCRMDPKPVQNPHIPLIVGGFSKPALRRAARIGSGWLGFGINAELTQMSIGMVDEALAAAGRSRDGFEIIITPMAVDADAVREYQDMGIDRLVPLIDANDPEDKIEERLRELEEFANIVA
jgi:probable F420-dependent oxidoreductase